MQAYSDPRRADDPHALPDVEVFYVSKADVPDFGQDENGDFLTTGWYWRTCIPGCLPDSDPIGPFDTEAEALADAQYGYEDLQDDDE